MNRHRFLTLMRLVLVAVALTWGIQLGNGQNGRGQGQGNSNNSCVVNGKTYNPCPPGLLKQANREAARRNAAPQKTGVSKKFAGVHPAAATLSPLAPVVDALPRGPGGLAPVPGLPAGGPTLLATMTPNATPDYFGVGNYANSPLPVISATGTLSGGIRKFVDTLPGLCALGTNDLGQCLPLATADTTTFPGNDFYRIGLQEYTLQMHKDLPGSTLATKLRGYVQLNPAGSPVYDPATPGKQQYLGPLILATRNRPVRVLFKNMIGTDLNIPVDTTYKGAGPVSNGAFSQMASQKRATLHLHGGNTPWISDGTTHQWITPAGGDNQVGGLGFKKGVSFVDVPDMVPPGCVGAKCVNPLPSLSDGLQTFYWTNQQSGRLMFYHDHAFGITRLNVYAGEAAGYLLVDGNQEAPLRAATVPGTILTNPDGTANLATADLTHIIPLVIQDKTFVPDNAAPGTQLAAQDPTWDVIKWGGLGSMWFPHVYTPNQNPADLTGANGFGRSDWGPWFWPPQNPATLALQPYPCTSAATPPGGWAFPPLLCPGVPDPTRPAPSNSPAGVPEAFVDTPVVNGTAYPSLTVDPTAYRFHILSVGNDRTFNLGLYVADPLAMSITTGGSGYAPPPALPPAVTITGCTSATAVATVDANGAVIDITVTYPPTGPGCTGAPTVAIAAPPPPVPPATASQAYAIASVNTEVKMVPALRAVGGGKIFDCPTSQQPPMAGGGLVTALLDATGKPLNGTGLPAGCWPLYNSLFGYTAGPYGPVSWGNADARLGGVPDPATAGPPIIQIGTEGGLLPAPSVIPSTPISYDYNKRSITVLNVLNHGLYLGPAERADVIVDFSAFAGKTLILYNDAPAPVPAGDPRLDYFTNDPDFSASGGAPTTMAGYGPNTRTIMQIVVRNTTPTTTFSLPALTAALPGIFAATQDPIIVPQTGYGAATNTYARIQDNSLNFTSPTSPSGICPTLPCAVPMLPKTIQELFTLDYGRMNATLGVELPFTNFLTQTTIPYGYADPPTEIFKDGETQIWKITHNGVDTHFIHFHLFTVQVINRVGWDGAVKPPDPDELSFKDTVRMNPLEDIIVALKPLRQNAFPFDVPNSKRPLDPLHPVGYTSTTDFTNVDPTNQPAAVVNDLVNFGWEYVWHCHILGHEENDMMRAMILAVAPNVPTITSAVPASMTQVNLTWTEAASPPYTGFTIQRSQDPTFLTGVTSFTVGPTPLTYADTTVTPGTYYYRMLASNLVGYTRTYAAPAAGYPHVSADSGWTPSVTVLVGGPALSLTPPGPLSFSSPLNVTSAGQVVTVTNTGAAPLTINSIALGGTDAGQFARTTACPIAPATLAATLSCTINITFTPTVATPTAKSASLTVTVAAPAISQSVVLNGTILLPVLTVAPPGPLSFSSPLNVTSAGQVVTVTNTGVAPLTINSIALGGTDAGQFVRTTACPIAPATLAAATSCTINLAFTPTTASPVAKTASLNITVAAPATSQSVVLNGTVLLPVLTVAPPGPLSFSSPLNVTSAAQVLTVTNTGAAPLTINSITIGGTNPGQFARTTACPIAPAALAATASCTISVTFTPTITNPVAKTALLTVTVAAPATTKSVVLNGTVLVPVLTLAPPGPLSFSSQLGVTSAAQLVTVTNNGGTTLTINSVTLTGLNPNQFGRTTTCGGATLAAGANCTISVTFRPTAATPVTKTASLNVNVAAPGTSQSVALTGTVLPPATFTVTTVPASSPLALAFGNWPAAGGATAAKQVVITNTSAVSTLTVTGSTITGTAGFARTPSCAGALGPGLSCTINVIFNPTSVGLKTATLNVVVTAPATPTTTTVALSGTGT